MPSIVSAVTVQAFPFSMLIVMTSVMSCLAARSPIMVTTPSLDRMMIAWPLSGIMSSYISTAMPWRHFAMRMPAPVCPVASFGRLPPWNAVFNCFIHPLCDCVCMVLVAVRAFWAPCGPPLSLSVIPRIVVFPPFIPSSTLSVSTVPSSRHQISSYFSWSRPRHSSSVLSFSSSSSSAVSGAAFACFAAGLLFLVVLSRTCTSASTSFSRLLFSFPVARSSWNAWFSGDGDDGDAGDGDDGDNFGSSSSSDALFIGVFLHTLGLLRPSISFAV